MAQLGVLGVVLACLGLQGAASFRVGCLPHGLVHDVERPTCTWATWPFLDYPMFRGAHHEGESVHQDAIVATRPDGSEWTVVAFPQGEPSDLRAAQVARALRAVPEGTSLRLVRVTFALGRRGIERRDAVTLARWCAGEPETP